MTEAIAVIDAAEQIRFFNDAFARLWNLDSRNESSQNCTIQEGTFGLIKTLWKNRDYGDLKIITQASYLSRSPWSNASTPAGASAHLGMGFVDLR